MTPLPSPPLEDLPDTFPVFPLPGALLLPGGKLPLNIFEPRYLALTEDALANGRIFGMIQPDRTQPDTAHGPALFHVGCLGRLVSFSETDDGRYLITLRGLVRFRVDEELSERRGYRRVRAKLAPFAADLVPVDGFTLDRKALLDALRKYFVHHGIDANWDAIKQIDDASLVTTLSMVCPFEAAEKQALLEAADATARAQALLTLLWIDQHDAPDHAKAS